MMGATFEQILECVLPLIDFRWRKEDSALRFDEINETPKRNRRHHHRIRGEPRIDMNHDVFFRIVHNFSFLIMIKKGRGVGPLLQVFGNLGWEAVLHLGQPCP